MFETMSSQFKIAHGFDRQDVTIANWRTAPFSRWSFQNVAEIVPTAQIECLVEQPEVAIDSTALLDAEIDTGFAEAPTIRSFLDHAHTDAFVLMRCGKIVGEYYPAHAHVNARHLAFSVSKSLTALVSGILEHQGILDPERPVLDYLPEAAGSAYGDCSYRDVLDMRISLDFDEAYLTRDGAFARYRRAMLWNPLEPGTTQETLKDFLMSLGKGDGPHGGPFHYNSPNADLLGIVIERATGRRFGALMSDLLWKPLGACNHALVTVDAIGTPRTAGGICVSARDLARVGEMLRLDGKVGATQVVPQAWINDMRHAGDSDAWKADSNTALPNGRYRSQWYQSGEEDGSFCAIGIHGQWLYVDPEHETVIVKLSSHPDPLGDETRQDIFTFFRALSRMAI